MSKTITSWLWLEIPGAISTLVIISGFEVRITVYIECFLVWLADKLTALNHDHQMISKNRLFGSLPYAGEGVIEAPVSDHIMLGRLKSPTMEMSG